MSTRVRIATWCVGGVISKQTLLCKWLACRKPDLVALQKTLTKKKNFPEAALSAAEYESAVFSSDGAFMNGYGVAVLCRRTFGKMQVLQEGLPNQKDPGARLLTVCVRDLEFSSVYALFGNPKTVGVAAALQWMQLLREHVGDPRTRPRMRVLAGDFNVVADGEPKIILDAGFDDLADGTGPNFFGFDPKKPANSRLHRVLGTTPVKERLRDAWVDDKFSKQILDPNGKKLWVSSAPVVADLSDLTLSLGGRRGARARPSGSSDADDECGHSR